MARQGIRIIDLEHKRTLREKLDLLLKEKNEILSKVFHEPIFRTNAIIKNLSKNYNYIKEFVCSTEIYLSDQINKNKKVLFEGAQGVMLDINFGTYPFVTSSSTISAEAATGTGVPASRLETVIGILKAYTTRVGYGPFPTEIFDNQGLSLREFGTEYGATTGRPRRCGWLDLVALRHSIKVSGINSLVLTKVDVLSIFKTIKVCVGYKIRNKKLTSFPHELHKLNIVKPIYKEFNSWDSEQLSSKKIPRNLIFFIKFIENFLSAPISMISIGPERNQIIYL